MLEQASAAVNREGWQKVRLDDVICWFQEDRKDIENFKYYVTANHIDSDSPFMNKCGKILDGLKGPTITKKFEKGDLLLSTRSVALRKASTAHISGLTGEKILVLRVKNPEMLIPEIMPFLFHTSEFWDYASISAAGSINKFTSWTKLREYEFLLPPVKKQKEIAELMWEAEDSIENADDKIEQATKLKIGLMNELFSNNTKKTKFGKNPEQWDFFKAKDLCLKITKGSSPKWQGYEYQKSGMIFITSENVRDGFLDVSSPKFLPIEFHEKLNKSQLTKGDILINLVGASIGRLCIYDKEFDFANINQAVCLMRVGKKLDRNFTSYYIQNKKSMRRLLSTQAGSARNNISLSTIREFPIPAPQLPEQKQIASILSDADANIDALRAHREKLVALKASLIETLLDPGTANA